VVPARAFRDERAFYEFAARVRDLAFAARDGGSRTLPRP
jgi:hypothetical protein